MTCNHTQLKEKMKRWQTLLNNSERLPKFICKECSQAVSVDVTSETTGIRTSRLFAKNQTV